MAKKRKRRVKKEEKSYGMSIFIVLIMATSAFGVAFYGFAGDSGNQVARFGDYKFELTNLGYESKINKETYHFDLLPPEVETMEVEVGVKNTILDAVQGVILTSSQNSNFSEEIALSEYRMYEVLSKNNKLAVTAFTDEATAQLPPISCANATSALPVIEFMESNETRATIENAGCVKVHFSSSYELQRVSNKILYLLLGVLDE